jgi:SAM-dependent methyltransferase
MTEMAAAAAVEFRCPVHLEPLDRSDPNRWVGIGHGEEYPVVDEIPILLPDRAERQRVAQTDWTAPIDRATDAVSVYNSAALEAMYSRERHDDATNDINRWMKETQVSGPALEIGSGRGALQGLGQNYVALDYSLTSLRRNIERKHPRVCATAQRLPFGDATFALVFTVNALEHVPRADLAFDEIDRVLKPGGIGYVLPSWHCVQFICDGIRVRPYSVLTLTQRLTKLSLPLRRSGAVKALAMLPGRAIRRAAWRLTGAGRPTKMRFKPLRPDYEHFWESDSDACCRLDIHEAVLFFQSRRYDVFDPGGGTLRKLLARHQPLAVRKPLTAAA